MMSYRDPLGESATDPPVLVCADLQCEYLAEGRKHLIADGDLIMSRCRQLIALWRGNLWPVLHLKRIAQAAWFNPASNLTNWLPEVRPTPGELTFEHPLPSAYSSARFAEYMSNMRGIRCVLVIEDAVACRLACDGDVAAYKLVVTRVISNFAGVLDSADLTRSCGRLAV